MVKQTPLSRMPHTRSYPTKYMNLLLSWLFNCIWPGQAALRWDHDKDGAEVPNPF